MTMTHEEGVLLRDAIVKSGRIFQLGSQQRSRGPNEQFRKACEFVLSGRVGQLKAVEIGLPTDPTKSDDFEQPKAIESELRHVARFDAESLLHREQRVHSQTDVGIPVPVGYATTPIVSV